MKEMLSEELLLQIKSHNDKGLYFEQYDPSPVIDRMYHDIRSLQQQVNTLQQERDRFKKERDYLISPEYLAIQNKALDAAEQQVNTLEQSREKLFAASRLADEVIETLSQQVNTLTKQIEAALTDLEAYKPLTAIVVLKSALQSIKESPREEKTK
jgi:chromosome segregation ATPase